MYNYMMSTYSFNFLKSFRFNMSYYGYPAAGSTQHFNGNSWGGAVPYGRTPHNYVFSASAPQAATHYATGGYPVSAPVYGNVGGYPAYPGYHATHHTSTAPLQHYGSSRIWGH